MDKPSPLLDVAGAVADLTPVDWPALEAEAIDPVSRVALKRLRIVDRIVRACAAIVPPDAATESLEQTPVTWGPLTIHERIGHGTFGDVYRAHERRLDRVVALKLLKRGPTDDEAASAEVIQEARLLAKVRHPNVVTVHGAERIDGRVGMWMEFVDGRTLEEELRASGPELPDKVIDVGLALCSALTAVHDAGLLHRDLKAQNVMRASDGRLLLTDFGAGRVRSDADRPEDGTELAGTPLYLAPEVLGGGPASVASELYSVGVLLYHLATGSFPVRGRSLPELQEAHARGERVGMHAYRDKVPRALASVIDRATDPDPAKRFTSPQALRHALLRCRGSARRVVAWTLVPVVAAALTVAVLNLIWSMTPPLEIVSQTVVDLGHTTDFVSLMGVKGDRLYYSREDKAYSVVPGRPGSGETLSEGAGLFRHFDVSPVREEYLAMRDDNEKGRELWLVSSRAGNRPVGNTRCDLANWSPDGRQVLCLLDNVISITTPDGTQSRIVPTPTPGRIMAPRWSPRGDAVRFIVERGTRGDVDQSLWQVRTDGTGLRPVLPGWNVPPTELFGEWTRDGQYYVFASELDGRGDLWAVREPRGFLDWSRPQPFRLTNGPISFASQPIVSYDDRTMIAIGQTRKGALARYDLVERRFVPYLNGLSATSVSRSPDGKSIAYISYPEKKLWRADADGSHARQLVSEPVNMDSASWSPDNKWIAFTAGLEGRQLKIFLVPVDASAPPRAISADDRAQGYPSWSRDAKQLCFGDVPERYGQPDGSEVLHLYDLTTHTISAVPGSQGLWSCRWSPDGRYIAGVTISLRPRDQMRLNIYDRQENVWRPVPGALHVNTPTWSHDSAFVYYETEGGSSALRRVRVSDGTVEDLVNIKGERFVLGWSGLAADDSPLLLRNLGSSNLYALKLGHR